MTSDGEHGNDAGRSTRPAFALIVPWELNHVGGVNRVVSDLYSGITCWSDFQPLVIVSSWSNRRLESGSDTDGRRTLRFRFRAPFFSRDTTLWALLSYVLHLPSQLRAIWRLACHENVKIANFHYIEGHVFTWAVLRWIRIYNGSLVLSFHGTDLHELLAGRGVARTLCRWMLKRADRLVVVSKEMERHLRREFQIPAERIQVICNGIDAERVRSIAAGPSRALEEERSSAKLIVNLGTFDHVKGHDVLLHAFFRLRRERTDVRLIIAGRAGKTLDATRDAIRAANLTDAVELWVDTSHQDAVRLLNAAYVVVVSSRREGFPLVPLEAGALRKPVVATAVGGIPELIENDTHGVLVPPGDADALYAAVSCLVENPGQAARLADSLHHRVIGEFSLRRTVDKYMECAVCS